MIKTILFAAAVFVITTAGAHAAGVKSKVTLVSEDELPNVPGKSMKGVLVEYGPAKVYKVGESWSEYPGDRHSVSENASKTEPAKLLAAFVVDTDAKELVLPYHD